MDNNDDVCRIPIVPNRLHNNRDVEIEMWGTADIPCTIYGDDTIDAWFSNIIQQSVQLATLRNGDCNNAIRPLSTDWITNNLNYTNGIQDITTSFSDGFTISIGTLPSLRQLNQQIVADHHTPISIDRFRLNIILDGWSLRAWDEDNWLYSIVNNNDNMKLHYPKPIDRCAVPLIDQSTGINDQYGEPTLALRKIHSNQKWYKSSVPWIFGLNTVHEPADGLLKLGDTLHTVYRNKPQWFPSKP